jgi:hypothetical protein
MTVLGAQEKARAATPARAYKVLLYCSLPLLLLLSTYLAIQHLSPNASVFGGENGFGPSTQSLSQQHRWGFVDQTYGLWCYACRLPVIPFLQAASSRFSSKMVTFVILKNLLFWPMWAFALFRLKRHYRIPHKWALAPVLLMLLTPYNLNIAGWADVEEGFLFALVAVSFSLLLTLEGPLSALALGLSLATVYLTKSSMFPLCLVVSLWMVIRYWRKPRILAIPILSIVLSVLGWGIYIHAVSGVFAFGADTSSWNGWNFYKGNNPYAGSLYPRVSLDTLDSDDRAHGLLPSRPIHSEWELNHAQFALARTYIREHPASVLQMDAKKLFVACCDVKESPEKTKGHTRIAVILNNVVSHLTLACVFALGIANVLRHRVSHAETLAVLLTFSYLLPYFAGFVYMRHMVPIYGVLNLTLAIQLTRWRTQSPEMSELSPQAQPL